MWGHAVRVGQLQGGRVGIRAEVGEKESPSHNGWPWPVLGKGRTWRQVHSPLLGSFWLHPPWSCCCECPAAPPHCSHHCLMGLAPSTNHSCGSWMGLPLCVSPSPMQLPCTYKHIPQLVLTPGPCTEVTLGRCRHQLWMQPAGSCWESRHLPEPLFRVEGWARG